MTLIKPVLYFLGANPTSDIALFRPVATDFEVLLIRRVQSSSACPGLLAFPGGFIESLVSNGVHQPAESPEQAARRELNEETGLNAGSKAKLIACGVWDASWRDPRNSADRFTTSYLFCAMMPHGYGPAPKGLDDAEEGGTQWFSLPTLKGQVLAFDHGAMLSACCVKLGLQDPNARSWSLERMRNK